MTSTAINEDPFEAFDKAAGSESVQNPYPMFAKLRARGAAHKAVLKEREAVIGGIVKAGQAPSGATADAPFGYGYTVVRYPAAMAVIRDDATFSTAGYAASMGVMLGNSILNMDRPEHTRYRSLVQQAFSKGAMARWEEHLVGPVVDSYLDAFVDAGSADLVGALTFPFPVRVFAGVFGLPEEHLDDFHREAVAMVNMGHDWKRALAASQWLHEFFAGLLDERRRSPGEDMVSVLAGVEFEGARLGDEDIFAFLRLMLPAGVETTYRSTSNLLKGLLDRPDQLKALTEDRSLIPKAVEEGLRWEGPVTAVARTAIRDTEIAGVEIPAGSLVTVSLGAANHDHDRWGPTAEELDIHRPSQAHLAFANGPHVCLGLQLARIESKVVLNRILDRLPNLRLDPAADPALSTITGLAFRSPRALPVRFG